jgi:hypothetical protein
VQEHHDVGVLFDGSRLAEVGQAGPFVLPLLDAAVELCQRDDGDAEILGEKLQPAGDRRNLLLAGEVLIQN